MTIHAPGPAPTRPSYPVSRPTSEPTTETVRGCDVTIGDRLLTRRGWSAVIDRFDTPPPGSFAHAFYGPGVRIPFHADGPIARPIPAGDTVTIQPRRAGEPR